MTTPATPHAHAHHHDHDDPGHDHAGHDHGHHDHGHDRHRGHGHGHHHHAPSHFGRAFAIAITLNIAFVVIEVVAGFLSDSMALIADAGHNFSDVLSLVLAWGAARLASRPPSARFTYGMKSSSILAAMANAALLWVALGAILIETLRRLGDPGPVAAPMVMVVATAGIVVNAVSALLFAGGDKHDLNMRAAFQHLLADAAVSAGVVVAGALVWWTGQSWIDPLTSLVVTAVIGFGSWGLLRDSLHLGLHAVPAGIDEGAVRAHLAAQPGVSAVHDLHIWPMSTTETALTAHLVIPAGHPGDPFLHDLAAELAKKFKIGHATVQVETEEDATCALEPASVV